MSQQIIIKYPGIQDIRTLVFNIDSLPSMGLLSDELWENHITIDQKTSEHRALFLDREVGG